MRVPEAPSPPTSLWTTLGLAMAAAVPLAWCRFVADEYILPEVVLLSAGLLLAAAGAMISQRAAKPTGLSTPLDRPLAAVLLAWALAAAFSLDPRTSAWGAYGSRTYGFWQVASCALLFQLTACCADEPARRIVLKTALSAAMLASGYAVLQAAGLDPLVAMNDLPGGRAVSSLGNPVFLGAYLALWLPVALHWAVAETKDKAFGRCALAMIGAGLLASVSRGAWLASAAGAAVYLGLTGRLRAPRWSAGRWVSVALASAAAAAWIVRALLRRSALNLSFGSERLEIWKSAVAMFLKHPFLGVGPDAFEQGLRLTRTEELVRVMGQGYRLGHAHNDLLQVLATTGLLGLAAYLWLLAAAAAAARRALSEEANRERSAALAAGLAALFVNLQLNIVSLPAYVSAALAAGVLLGPLPRARAGAAARHGRLAIAVIFAASSSVLCVRLVAADREVKLARESADPAESARRYRAALARNPCELAYRLGLEKLLSDQVGKTAGSERQAVVDEIAGLGPEAVACHPNDAVAHYIAGTGALLQAILGRRERLTDAEAELDAALKLDPYRLDLIDWRRQAATLRGDKELEGILLKRLAHLGSLHR